MVPKGWQSRQVSDICRLKNGHGFKPEEWDTKGLPIIRIQNLNGSQNFNYFSGVPEPDWLVQPGQMLFAWAGTKGVSFGPTIWNGETGVLNQHIFKVFAEESIDENWLYYSLKHVTHVIERKAHGFKATLVHVKKSEIDQHPVYVPPLNEQQRIAEIVSSWDRAIEAVAKLIESSERQRRGLMQHLFDPTRVEKSYQSEYRRFRVHEIAHVDRESLPGNTDPHFAFEYISLSDVSTGQISDNLVTHRYVDAPSRARRIVKAGDILMATVRPNLQAFARVFDKHQSCIASTGFAVITTKSGFDSDYVYHYLLGPHMTGQVHSLVVGSSYPAINSHDVKGLAIYCPSIGRQQEIARTLNAADNLVLSLRLQLEQLKQEKTALMQQLLTGKRRVKVDGDVDRIVQEAAHG